MQIFIDTGNVAEIRKWLAYGVIDGATTNPTILLKDGCYDYEVSARELAAVLGEMPLNVEVTTNDLEMMGDEARMIAGWAPNIVAKIPVINEDGEPCLGVIKSLVSEGIKVNCTACLSFNQVMLAAKTGADYISMFVGRINDEGNDGSQVIRRSRQWLDAWGFSSKLIVGSVRQVMDIQLAAEAGAHIITIPPEFLRRMVDHKYTRATVAQFTQDAAKALAELENQKNAKPDRLG